MSEINLNATDATAADIMKDKTAYVNGVKITGTIETFNGNPLNEENE